MRADIYLFTYGYVKSRQKAKDLILASNVKINNVIIKKPSVEINEAENNVVEIFDNCPFVSRGGLKLQAMLDVLKLDLNNKIAIDIGASTGGFTDCLISNGIKLVYAVDSGSNQLDESLKNNDKVISIENFNAKDLNLDVINQKADVITVDVSFISQTQIMPVVAQMIKDDGIYISLIKPQFEVGRGKIGKGGIVKEKKYRYEAVMRIFDFASKMGFNCIEFIPSPITGGDGNIEYLAAFTKKIINVTRLNKIEKIVLEKRGQYEIKETAKNN